MSAMPTQLQAIMQYLSGRGMDVTEADERELLARYLGHANAATMVQVEDLAKIFRVYRADLDDFEPNGFFGCQKTLLSPVLFEGSQDEAYVDALRESVESLFAYVVVDGNGKLCNVCAKSDFALAAYYSIGSILDENAASKDSLSNDFDLLDAEMYSWAQAGAEVAKAKASHRSGRWGTRDRTFVVVVAQNNGRILWKQEL